MCKNKSVEYIKNAGLCIVSKRIINGESKLKWLLREKPIENKDTGWRFFSIDDDTDYINNENNLQLCDYNVVANIEPAIIGTYFLPVGSDLQLVSENGKLIFYDNISGQKITPIYKPEIDE